MFVTTTLRTSIEPIANTLLLQAELLQYIMSDIPREGMEREVWLRGGERSLQIAIECIADMGNQLIDALIMRDPSSYADIIKILRDEYVVEEALSATLDRMVKVRRILTQDYVFPVCNDVWLAMADYPALQEFVDAVNHYLDRLS